MGKKLIVLLSIIVLFSCCKTTKKSVVDIQKEIETKEKIEIKKTDVTDVLIDGINKSINTLNERTKVNIVIYDTSLPVDSNTGKHPIKAEVNLEKDIEKERLVDNHINVVLVDSTEVETDVEKEVKEDDKLHKEENKEVGTSGSLNTSIKWFSILLTVLIITILISKVFKFFK